MKKDLINELIGDGKWIEWKYLMIIKSKLETFFGYYPKSQFDSKLTEREIETNSEVFILKQGRIIHPLIDDIIKDIKTRFNISEIDYITLTPDSGNKSGNSNKLQGFSLIIQYIANELNIEIILPEIIKSMGKQKNQTRLERIKNRRGAYSFKNIDLRGKKVLFIDDVITTGATMCTIGENLINNGGFFYGYGIAQSELDSYNK